MSNTYQIGLIPGDGTGPEVVAEGIKALAAVAERNGFSYELVSYDIGGDRYLKTGETLPDSVLHELQTVDYYLSNQLYRRCWHRRHQLV